jgi:CHASE2 domain-containing sensor protein
VRYFDFDLWIDARTETGYPLRAACGAQGEARDVASLDASVDPLLTLLGALGRGETQAADLVRCGTFLYGAVFRAPTGDLEALFERSFGGLRDRQSEGLRIRLRLEPPQIAGLPWELLYSPRRERFLGTTMETALVRYVEVLEPVRPLQVSLPLRVLVLIPSAVGIDAQAEKAVLTEALRGLEKDVQVEILEGNVTRTRLSDALLEQRFHVLHFIGHGGFRDERPFLLLNDEAGGTDFVGHQDFSRLLLDHTTLKLAVLNSCEGATLSSSQPLVGMAAEMVKRGLPAVVAMQYPIRDRQAVVFAREFYRSLFKGWARGWIEVAVSHARRRLEGEFPGDRVVGTPVLFTRAPEGVLFDLVSGSLWRDAPYSPKRLSAVQALARAHGHDREILARAEGETAVPGAEGGPEQALAGIQRRIRFRNVSLASAAAVALLMFFLSWLQVFDRLPAELKVESYAVWMAGGFAPRTLDERIALVPIGKETLARLARGELAGARREYARLVEALATAGARVVAFDLYFQRETAADGELAEAVRAAGERGTAVVLGLPRTRGVEPPPLLREAPAAWGSLCAGRQGLKSAAIIPLLTEKPDGGGPPVSALTLAAMTALADSRVVGIDRERGRINLLDAQGRRVLPLAVSWIESGAATAGCPTIGDSDLVALLAADAMPLAAVRDPSRRLAYEELLSTSGAGGHPAFDLGGKVVLVGAEDDGDAFAVLRGLSAEKRYGFEIHADALDTLLRGAAIRPLRPAAQLALMLAFAGVAALLRAPALEARPRARHVMLAAAVVIYLAAGVYAYVAARLMVNTVYHLAALLLTYALLGRMRRQWWPS